MSLKNWFRRLFSIVKLYDTDREALRSQLRGVETAVMQINTFLRRNTNVAVDVSINERDMNTIIVVGFYNGRDYVQSYQLPGGEMRNLIEHLRHLEQRSVVRRLDAPPIFSAFMDHELGRY